MKLYYSKGACSLAVRIVINEIGLPCEFESVNLKTKQTETGTDFLTVTPKGAVPVLVTANREVLTENSVIQQYLADTQHAVELLPSIGDFKRYKVLEWLNFISTEVHKSFGPFFNPHIPQDLKDAVFMPALKNKFKFIEKHIGTHKKFLVGDHFTLPDAYLFVMLFWLSNFNINIEEWPSLAHYYAELLKRPAIVKSLKEEGF